MGVDALAHQYALEAGKQIFIHPPIKEQYRAWCMGIDVVWYPPKDYGVRDKDIVYACDLLVGVPKGPEVMRGSGTWLTIRLARERRLKEGKPMIRRLIPNA